MININKQQEHVLEIIENLIKIKNIKNICIKLINTLKIFFKISLIALELI
jgi:hypothetical protein